MGDIYACLNCGKPHPRGEGCPIVARQVRRFKALCEVRPHFKEAGFEKYVWLQTQTQHWTKWLLIEPRLAELAPDEMPLVRAENEYLREADIRRDAAE